MKRTLCIILIALMTVFAAGCLPVGGCVINVPGTPDPTRDPSLPTADPAATQAPGFTEDTSVTTAPDASGQPQNTEHTASNADEAFGQLDLEIFRTLATSSSDTYNQFIVSDPARFGIERADVTKGWGELTYEAHVESMDHAREMLGRLAAIDRNELSEKNMHAYDMLKRTYETQLLYEEYYYYDEPLTPLNGYHTMLPLSMVCYNVRSLEDVEDYLFLVGDMGRLIDQIGDYESEKAAQGLFMSEKALDQVIESCRNFAGKGERSFLITCFDDVTDKAKELGATPAQCAEYTARNRDLVLNELLPAYSRLADTLESHRADCSPYVGASQRGEKAKAYFELSAKDEGASMDDSSTIIRLLEQMGEDTYYDMCMAVLHGGNEIMNEYGDPMTMGSVEKNLEWLKKFLDQYYPDMPEYSLKYVDVPEDIADDFSPAAYLTPSFDDYYDNLMLLNRTSDGCDDLLTIAHETIPGHMYQHLMARNDPGLSLTQQVFEPTGYAEGWTVFTEKFIASKCFDLGNNYCVMMNCESTFCNVFLPAYISYMVNLRSWNEAQVRNYLDEYGIGDAADIYYEYAVTMPVYAMSYGVGYSYMYDIWKTCAPDSPAAYKAFFEKYLSFGPNYMDMMRDYME